MKDTSATHGTASISPAMQRFSAVNTEAEMSARQKTGCASFSHADNAIVIVIFRTENLILKVGFAVKMDLLHEDLSFVEVLGIAFKADIGSLGNRVRDRVEGTLRKSYHFNKDCVGLLVIVR